MSKFDLKAALIANSIYRRKKLRKASFGELFNLYKRKEKIEVDKNLTIKNIS